MFLDESDGTVTPVWFARAAHDEVGADLRRRWDDPLLLRDGDHPIVFAGAGSHAAYVEPGEYLQSVPLRLPRWLNGLLGAARQFWTGTLRQGMLGGSADGAVAAVPFVDYARGDGLAIGPGQEETWAPSLVGDDLAWVSGFAGLFGLDTKDRFAGERAPAGPKFNRDGRPRQSWIDPVGFAGLQAVPPPSREAAVLADQNADLGARARAGPAAPGRCRVARPGTRRAGRVVAARRSIRRGDRPGRGGAGCGGRGADRPPQAGRRTSGSRSSTPRPSGSASRAATRVTRVPTSTSSPTRRTRDSSPGAESSTSGRPSASRPRWCSSEPC